MPNIEVVEAGVDASDYKTMYGVIGDEVVEVQARPAAGGYAAGWVVKKGCFRDFVALEKLHATRAGAEARLKKLREEEG